MTRRVWSLFAALVVQAGAAFLLGTIVYQPAFPAAPVALGAVFVVAFTAALVIGSGG